MLKRGKVGHQMGQRGNNHHITFWIIFTHVNYHFPRSDSLSNLIIVIKGYNYTPPPTETGHVRIPGAILKK